MLGEVPSLVPNLGAGLKLGYDISQMPRQGREAQLKEQQNVRGDKQSIAMSLYAGFGQDTVTPENYNQFVSVAKQMGLPIEGLTPEKANVALQVGRNLFNAQNAGKGSQGYTDIFEKNGVRYGFNKATNRIEQLPTTAEAYDASQQQYKQEQEANRLERENKRNQEVWTQGQGLRKEYESKVKDDLATIASYKTFDAIQQSNEQALEEFKNNFNTFAGGVDENGNTINKESILADATSISDIALIFAYFKMVDPSSTVREGEFATIENAGGVGTRYANMYNKLLTGERLNDNQRAQIYRIAKNKFENSKKSITSQRDRYTKLAKQGKIPVEMLSFTEIESPSGAVSNVDQNFKGIAEWLEKNPTHHLYEKVLEKHKKTGGK